MKHFVKKQACTQIKGIFLPSGDRCSTILQEILYSDEIESLIERFLMGIRSWSLFAPCSVWLVSVLTLPVASEVEAQRVFASPPENFHPKFVVATCYIQSNQGFLFLERAGNSWKGTWGNPGGCVERGESPQAAVVREIFEETGLTFSPVSLEHLGTFYVRDPKKDFLYHMFRAHLAADDGPPVLSSEHSRWAWLTLEEALKYPLVPGEDECIRYLMGLHHS